MKTVTKSLAVLTASVFVLAGCSNGDSSVIPGASSDNTGGGSFSASPGDDVTGQYFTNISALDDFIGKVFTAVDNEISTEGNILSFGYGDWEGLTSMSYIVVDKNDGKRVEYSYLDSENMQPCNVPINLTVNGFQNLEVAPVDSMFFSFSDEVTMKETVFNTILAHESDINPDGWVANGKYVSGIHKDGYVRIIGFNTNGTINHVGDYVSAYHPSYGSKIGEELFILDEEGEIVINPETGEPLLSEETNLAKFYETVKNVLMKDGFTIDSLSDLVDPWLITEVRYNADNELISFTDGVRTASWWLEVGEQFINNPDLWSGAYSINDDIMGLGVAFDGSLFAYAGDMFSGLTTYNPLTGGNATLRDGSALACSPVVDELTLLEDEFGVIGGNNGGVMIDDPDILGYNPADFE